MPVDWKGESTRKRIQQACADAIETTMAACVKEAKKRPKMPVVTGTLQGSIAMKSPKVTDKQVVGKWGSFDVNYAFVQEVGAKGRSGRRFLRDAADKEYPKLGKRIASELK